MKQLTCEMCGSTDLMKDGGVFVCQTCGCKYSVEEARKMMVEGTVEVQGVVKVDDTEKIENYLDLSQNAYNSGNGETAIEYANKALEIAPRNSAAWIAKMKAIEHIGTLGDAKLMEVVEAGKNAIKFADNDSKREVSFEVYSYEARRALELLKVATIKMADTEDIKKTFKQFCLISLLSAAKNTSDIDSKVVQIYDNIATEATALIHLIPDEALADFPEVAAIIKECAKQYQYETDALVARFEIYGASLTDSAKAARNTIRNGIEEKATAAEKIAAERQKARIERYWEEHHAEKEALNREKASLESKIKSVEKQIEDSEEVRAAHSLENQIEILKKEKSALGLFKGKERKAVQEKIDAVSLELKNFTDKIDLLKKKAEKETEPYRQRINEIDAEFVKER